MFMVIGAFVSFLVIEHCRQTNFGWIENVERLSSAQNIRQIYVWPNQFVSISGIIITVFDPFKFE